MDTSFESVAHELLILATTKLLALRQHLHWQLELPSRCPPILWFGNLQSVKPIVLTLGANPSRQEYLRDSSEVAWKKVQQTGDESLLVYLEPPANRFRLLTRDEKLNDVCENEQLRTDIIEGYNTYFSRNPYTRWFGQPKSDPYNVEGFLRGFGASYYDHQNTPFRAIHIDLFPFTTLRDFVTIQHLADADVFRPGWAQHFITALVKLLAPTALIVFGRTNYLYFARYLDPTLGKPVWQRYEQGAYCTGHIVPLAVPIIGLSTNLGNPKGFNRISLRQFGAHVAHNTGIVL